jgi:hypothetical protein
MMASETLIWFVAIMILYDLFMHIVAFILTREKAKKLWWFPKFKINGKDSENFYHTFWIIYWGVAFFLIMYYLITI